VKIKMAYKTRDELPKGMEELYDEVDGEFRLTGVEGMKTPEDVSRVQQSLVNERKAHGETKRKLTALTDVLPADADATVIAEQLSSLEELKAENDALKKKGNTIDGALRSVAADLKVIPMALDDVLIRGRSIFEIAEDGQIVTREGVAGVKPGLDPKAWLTDMQDKAGHWWATSVGGGAGGSRANIPAGGNPFSAKNWNMTAQGKYIQEHGIEKAQRLAAQAGTVVGGPQPKA